MIKTLCMLTLVWSSLSLAQTPDYQHGLIVLNDGRVVSMRGDWEVIGDEVHFMDGRGELVVLPVDKVDLDATEKRNQEIRSKSKGDGVVNDGSLYSKVEKYKRSQKKKGIELTNENMTPKVEMEPVENQPKADTGIQGQIERFGNLDAEQVEQWSRKIQEKLETTPQLGAVLIGFALLMLVFGLMTLITQIYLIVISFREGFFWWFSLLATFAGPFFLNLMGVFLGSSNFIYSYAPQVLQLLGFIAFPAFIISCCPGRRFKLLMLWGLFYLFAIGGVIALFIWILA